MKGLLRNNFYSMGTNLQISFGLTLILAFVPLILGDENSIAMVLAMQSFMFIANIGTSLHTDVTSKWNQFEITLPVKRSDVIKTRYLSFLILILCGIFMSVFTVLLSSFVFKTLSASGIIFGYAFGISLSLITAGFMYPIMLKIGTEKNELVIIICAGIAAVLFQVFLTIAAPFVPDNGIMNERAMLAVIFALFSIGLFLLSYFVSLSMYQRKEL